MKKLSIFIGFIFSISIVVYFAITIDLSKSWIHLKNTHLTLFLAAILLNGLSYYLRSWRWGLFFPRENRPFKIWNLFEASNVAALINNLIPARLGEIAKIAYLSWIKKNQQGAILASMIWDRLLDGIALAALVVYVLLYSPFTMPGWMKGASEKIGVAIVVFIITVFLMSTLSEFCIRIVHRLPYLSEKWKIFLAENLKQLNFESGMTAKLKAIVGAALLSAVIWACELLIIIAIARAISIDLSVAEGLALLALLVCATLAPSAPGYIGAIQLATILGFKIIGKPEPEALAFSVLYQFLIYLPATPLALYHLAARGTQLGQLKKSLSEIKS
ncbi:MAG: lysylphosphatidylglycerol synthase transmembrane domain-containing protein [Pseudobdellovibrionaceae bacterium]